MPAPVQVIKAFGGYRVGAVIRPTGVFRGQLLARRFVEPVEDQQPAAPPIEAAVAEAPEDTTPTRRRRRKAEDESEG